MKVKEMFNIYMRQDMHNEAGYQLIVIPDKYRWHAQTDDVKIAEKEAEFEVELPNNDEMIQLAIDTFDQKIIDIMDNAHEEVQDLKEKIKELQCITYQPQDQE